MEDWAEIRRLHLAEGIPIKEIARRLGLARNTVREAVRSATPPKYDRAATGSAVDGVEPEIRRLLARHPRMPATVIAERIGWERGMTVFRERVRDLRPVYLPPDPAGRTTYRPGELAQWDLWFPPVDIPIGPGRVARPPVLVGVAGYSRYAVGRMIPSRESHDLLLGHRACLVDLGRVPRAGVYDNEGAIGRWRRGVPQLTEAFQAFRGAFGMGVVLLKPGDPESKGLVERMNGYLETSFLPGRTFRSRPTSTASSRAGWSEPTNVSTGSSAADRSIGSSRTGRRCWPSRRSCPTRRSGRARGWAVTTTSGSSVPTTRSIPGRSVGGSTSGPTSTRSP